MCRKDVTRGKRHEMEPYPHPLNSPPLTRRIPHIYPVKPEKKPVIDSRRRAARIVADPSTLSSAAMES